jgi:environmental stress-induced protein Ves
MTEIRPYVVKFPPIYPTAFDGDEFVGIFLSGLAQPIIAINIMTKKQCFI